MQRRSSFFKPRRPTSSSSSPHPRFSFSSAPPSSAAFVLDSIFHNTVNQLKKARRLAHRRMNGTSESVAVSGVSSSSQATAALLPSTNATLVPEVECGIGVAPPSGASFAPAIFSLSRRTHFVDTLMRRGVISRTRYWDEATVRGRCQDIVCEFVPDHSLRSQQDAFQRRAAAAAAAERAAAGGKGKSISSDAYRLRSRGRSSNDNVFVFSHAFVKTELARGWWVGPDVRDAAKARMMLASAITNKKDHDDDGDQKKKKKKQNPVRAMRITHSELRTLLHEHRIKERLQRNAEIRRSALLHQRVALRNEQREAKRAAAAEAAQHTIVPRTAYRGAYSGLYRHMKKELYRDRRFTEREQEQKQQEEEQDSEGKSAEDAAPLPDVAAISADQKRMHLREDGSLRLRRGLGLKFRFKGEMMLSPRGKGQQKPSLKDVTSILAPLPFSNVEYRYRRVYCCPDFGVQIHITSTHVMKSERRRSVLGHLGDGKIVLTRTPFVPDGGGGGGSRAPRSGVLLLDGGSARGISGGKAKTVALNQFWRGHSHQATVELEMVDPLAGDPEERVRAMFAVANEIIDVAFPKSNSSAVSKRLRRSEEEEKRMIWEQEVKAAEAAAAEAAAAAVEHDEPIGFIDDPAVESKTASSAGGGGGEAAGEDDDDDVDDDDVAGNDASIDDADDVDEL